MTKVWECTDCGYEHEGPRPPTKCPECGAAADLFDMYEYDEGEEWDLDDDDDDWDDDDDDEEDDDEDEDL